jgi:hypothetical protein
MARSDASTPDAYIAEQPADRAAELSRVRDAVNAALPDGYVEGMAWGMICWEVPMAVSGPTYNGQPLAYVALGAQKNYNALYVPYGSNDRSERFRRRFIASGRKLDMGKSCVRFRKADDVDLDAVAELIGALSPYEFVAETNAAHASAKKR